MSELNSASRWFLEARLKFRHLRLFVALDEHRNIVRAAESIGLSQPAASKMLADVEKALGARLFERLPRGLEANELGDIFIRRSRLILSELNKAGNEFFALRGGHAGVVNVGTISAPGLELIAGAINVTRKQNPQVEIWVDVGTTEYLLKRVADTTLDFAIGWISPDLDQTVFEVDLIRNEKFNFICRAGHPLLKTPDIHLRDLVGAEWVLQSPGSLVRHAADSLFIANKLPPPERVINTTSFISTLVFLRETDAISVASTAVAALFASLGGFQILPVAEPFGSEPLGIVSRAGVELRPTARAFLDAVKHAVEDRRKADQAA